MNRLLIGIFVLMMGHSSYCSPSSDEALVWAKRLANSVIHDHPEAWKMRKSDGEYRWGYTQGLVLQGFLNLAEHTQAQTYERYAKAYLDHYIDDKGNIRTLHIAEFNIDAINSGKLLFHFYNTTHDTRYLNAMKVLRRQLEWQPRTRSRVFWHKRKYPWQIWLDGLYMAAPFYAQYTAQFENNANINDVILQFKESHNHLYDPKTGLLFHGFDESRMQDWSDELTGQSPEFWSRALGWYSMALMDTIEHVHDPKARATLISIAAPLLRSIIQFQDDDTGLWYQVINRGGNDDNFLEASASAMFIYSIAKATRLGVIEKNHHTSALKAFEGMKQELLTYNAKTGAIQLQQVCRSAGLGGTPYRDGSYRYYTQEVDIVTNDAHGMGALLLALVELSQPQ